MGHTQKTYTEFTPLEALAQMMDGDMRETNAVIIDRMESPVALIPQLATYLIAAGGKRIRPLLTLATTFMYKGDMKRAQKLAASVEFIHTATLLHDDVVDESAERRGQETANLIFGNQASVLVGDFLFSRAFELMTECDNIAVLKILSKASSVITQGEVLQLSKAGDINITMDDYIEIITSKTAALFAAACEVGPVLSGASQDDAKAMHDYGLNMGIAFQIADDALDYNSDAKTLGKTIGDDFREGKITAPILIALKQADETEKEFWKTIMTAKKRSDQDLDKAQAILLKHNSIQSAYELAEDYAQKAQEALTKTPNSPLHPLLHDLVPYTIFRKT
ncbi:MAG: polyprenyl synthetase family protein [Bdellovibrionales bacterium]